MFFVQILSRLALIKKSIPLLFSRTPPSPFFFFHHGNRRTQHHTEYQTLSACQHEADEVEHGKTVRDFREYENGITVAVNDVTAVLMGDIFGYSLFCTIDKNFMGILL